MIDVEGLECRFPGAAEPVLHALTFRIAAGEAAAILGKSGAGKTTLLRCLVGLDPFDRGAVTVDGVRLEGAHQSPPVQRARSLAALRARVGLVFQSFELFSHLSVLDNCTLALGKVKRLGRSEAEAIAIPLLQQLGLADKATDFPEHLSGGQQQRVAIARALAMKPKVLLYDEPTSALDPSLKREVFQTLLQVKASGVTQLLVTHDLELARAAARTAFILDRGRIIEQGETSQILDAPANESTRRLLAKWDERT